MLTFRPTAMSMAMVTVQPRELTPRLNCIILFNSAKHCPCSLQLVLCLMAASLHVFRSYFNFRMSSSLFLGDLNRSRVSHNVFVKTLGCVFPCLTPQRLHYAVHKDAGEVGRVLPLRAGDETELVVRRDAAKADCSVTEVQVLGVHHRLQVEVLQDGGEEQK